MGKFTEILIFTGNAKNENNFFKILIIINCYKSNTPTRTCQGLLVLCMCWYHAIIMHNACEGITVTKVCDL